MTYAHLGIKKNNMSDIDACFEKIRLSMEEMQDHFKKQECKVVEMSQKIIDMERRLDQLSVVKNPIETGYYLDLPATTQEPIETGEDYLDLPATTPEPNESDDYLDLPATTPDADELSELENKYYETMKELKEYNDRFSTGSPPRGRRGIQKNALEDRLQRLAMEIHQLRK